MKRGWRWLKRLLIGVLALTILMIVVAVIAMHTSWGRDIARAEVESALRGSFPGGAKVGKLQGSVFGTLVVHDLELDGLDGKPWITVGTAKVRLALLPLVRKVARVEWLELDDVAVDQHPQPERPPKPEQPKGAPSPWSVELPEVVVQHARVRVATASRVIELADVEAAASMSIEHGAITAAASATATYKGRRGEASTLARYADGTVAAPFVTATVDRAGAIAMGVRVATQIDGIARAWLPAETVRALADTKIPGDVVVVAKASGGDIDVKAGLADATVRVVAHADVASKTARGLVIAEVPDGARLDPRFAGSGIVTASLDAGLDHVRGIVTLDGVRRIDPALVGRPEIHGKALIAVDATLKSAWLYLDAGLDLGGARATGLVEATRTKDTYSITKSTFVATARKVGAPKADLWVGSIAANARATGRLWPKPDLHVTGTIAGDEVRYDTTSAATLDVRFDARKAVLAHVDLGGVKQGARLLGAMSFDARATIDKNGAIGIDVDSHTITTTSNGVWSGTGGHVAIDDDAITVRDFRTGNGDGKVVASASFVKATKDLDATVDASNVALATLAPELHGTAGAKLAIGRHGGRWQGGGHVVGHAIEIPRDPQATVTKLLKLPPLDIDGELRVAGRRVTIQTTTSSDAGAVKVAVDVDGPADLTDPRAWRRLDRRALRDASVELVGIDGTRLGRSGTVSGKLALSAKAASGKLELASYATSSGEIDGSLAIGPKGKNIAANVTASLRGIATVDSFLELGLPDHLFEPMEWKALGTHVLRGGTVRLRPLDVDPDLLARLHVEHPYRAHVEATVSFGDGAHSASATVDVQKLAGGAVKQPIDLHAEGTIDDGGAHVAAALATNTVQLVTVDARAPIDLDHPRAITTAPITATIELPNTPARQIVAIVGRNDISAGTVAGKIAVAGTIAVPTVQGRITAEGITIPASIQGRAPAKLEKLVANLNWGGASGEVDVIGNEAGGGVLHLAARGRPDQPATLVASFEAAKFDIAPITAFGTGAVAAAKGTIDAALVLKGFDPATGDLRGVLQIHNGRFPLSSLLGTLRSGEAVIEVANHLVKATVDAKLGKGEIHGTGSMALAGSTPSKADLDIKVKQISLVRAYQPTIDAHVTGELRHDTGKWTGHVTVADGHVAVATTGGVQLLDVSAPDDMVFLDAGAKPEVSSLLTRPPPDRPWLVAAITVMPTTIDVVQDEFEVRGSASGNVTLSLGQGSVGLDGTIDAQRGDIELLGARSQLDHGAVVFDGSVDPLLDVRIVRELNDMTVIADLGGRASKPEIQLTSDTGSYSQGELYSFFLGGEPSGDRGEVGQAAAAAGAGYASSLLTRQLNRRLSFLPGKLALNYEVGTAASSDAVRYGLWVNPRLFVAGRSHPEARIDENVNEGLFEYHFKNNTLLQGNLGDRYYGGLDFVRRWHW